ncbi:heterokaryon incompatibility protein-domain-containing protein [Schizothecium vesticola]|uniref:Heterokaryon incompatibility protein-domain-containing protein n=1 Tax=Schizothecium vesticola TaxID=314040 RepID=A0AA40F3J8_9PEZI|nr:heterokaryon incompatibility protein-domain-containing protein [Schizothecium vesticola]
MTDNDELCVHCAAVPLYDLFTGPRLLGTGKGVQDGVEHAAIGTLDQVWTNVNCPLCRMVKHCVLGGGWAGANLFEDVSARCKPSNIEVRLWPESVDRMDEMVFDSYETDEQLATRLVVRLVGLPHVALEVRDDVQKYYPSGGIQLLSPDSIDPTRPLRNGFLAPSMDDSLGLLRTWIDECKEHHRTTTCHPIDIMPGSPILPAHIRAIDVSNHALVEIDPAVSPYATLSYVWGDSAASYTDMVDSLGDSSTPRLPATVPQLMLDAIAVCTTLAIPYLWVDLYCIHQTNPELKAIEIALMGQIYRFSAITLVAGSPAHRTLLPPPDTPAHQQLTFTTASTTLPHKLTLITQPPPLHSQLRLSPWTTRSWTFQEGHLAPRLAFFNPPYPLIFVCSSGLFAPNLHSGPYGHSCHIPPLDLQSFGFHLVSGRTWLSTSRWSHLDYARIVHYYSGRELSFESDKLNALEGCLTALEERKRVKFLWGMPTSIFKEEFDTEQPSSSTNGVRPDMTPSPTPRELRRLASDHDFVLAAQHPRRLGLGPFVATHLSLVAALVAGLILVVVAIVYASTTSNQILECPDWAVDCRQADNWTVEHLGTVQGIVTLVFFVGLSALGYVALAFCEASVWVLLTLQTFKIRELEAYLSVTRGSVLAVPAAAMAVKTLPAGLVLAAAVVVTLIPLASIPMVGFAFTPALRSVVLEGDYTAGGGIEERHEGGDLPTAVKSLVPSRSLLLILLPSLVLLITMGVATWSTKIHKRNAIPVMRLAGLAETLKSAQTGYLRAHAATDGAKTYLPAGGLGEPGYSEERSVEHSISKVIE